MKTIEIQLYTINELSDQAKEKAREWYRRCNDGDSSWADFTIDEAVEQGKLLGIDFKLRDVKLYGGGVRQEPCIRWSGFSSQGDGACFEGTWRAKDVKANQVAKGWGDAPETRELKTIADQFAAIAQAWPFAYTHVTHRDCYCHERSVVYDTSLDPENEDNFPEPDFSDDHTGTIFEAYMEERAKYDERWTMAEDDLEDACRAFMRWIYRRLESEYTYLNSDECIDETLDANEYTFLEDGTRFKA